MTVSYFATDANGVTHRRVCTNHEEIKFRHAVISRKGDELFVTWHHSRDGAMSTLALAARKQRSCEMVPVRGYFDRLQHEPVQDEPTFEEYEIELTERADALFADAELVEVEEPKTFVTAAGFWHDGEVYVRQGDTTKPLPLFTEEVNHSPTGFAWGYAGSGPAQLAYALVREVTGDVELSKRVYMKVKFMLVSGLPQDQGWTIQQDQIERLVDEAEAELEAVA